MNKTQEIFSLAITETSTGAKGYGLSSGAIDMLAGCITSKSVAEHIDNALFFAEQFSDSVERAIVELKEKDQEQNEKQNVADLKTLEAMLNWTFDKDELVKLAKVDWAEYHEVAA